MPGYALHLERRPGYLFARVSGTEDNLEVSLAYWTEIGQELRVAGLKRVLVVEELKTAASAVETFSVASRLPDLGFRGATIAFVDTELDHLPDNQFGENVVKNRGVHGRLFNDVRLAEAWMEERVRREQESAKSRP